MATATELSAHAVRAALTVLAQDPRGSGMPFREVWAGVKATEPGLEAAWNAEFPGIRTPLPMQLRYDSIKLVKVGWLRKHDRVWSLTGPGRRALAEYTDPRHLWHTASRLYQHWSDRRGGFDEAARLLEVAAERHGWIPYQHLANAVRLEPYLLLAWLQSTRPPGWHLALADYGMIPRRELELNKNETEEWEQLLREGTDADNKLEPEDCRRAPSELAAPAAPAVRTVAPRRRAWFLRDDSGVLDAGVKWREENVCALTAERLSVLTPQDELPHLQRLVAENYPGMPVPDQMRLAGGLNEFLHAVRNDDLLVATDGQEVLLGTVSGDAQIHAFPGGSLLTRAVAWADLDSTADLEALDAVADVLGNSAVVMADLSKVLGDLELLLEEDPDQEPANLHDTAVLPDATQALADELTLRDTEWLQTCVELLRSRPQLILQGPPGTGKTFSALALARHLTGGRAANTKFVQFHPTYSYEDFVEGFRPRAVPVAEQDGPPGDEAARQAASASGIVFDRVPGPLKSLADRARKNPGETFVLVIDEINRGNLAQVFGELYFLLEYRNQQIDLMYGAGAGERFQLPRNLVIIGTMNTSDRSIALMDAAMRRRFWFVEIHPDKPPFDQVLRDWLERRGLPTEAADLLDALNARIASSGLDDPDFRVGPSYLMDTNLYLSPTGTGQGASKGLERVWTHQILPLLKELHWADNLVADAHYGLVALRRDLQRASASGRSTGTP